MKYVRQTSSGALLRWVRVPRRLGWGIGIALPLALMGSAPHRRILAAPARILSSAAPGNPAPARRPTTLIILGADHSAQLVDRRYHPGYFRLFLERLHPAAICIEQPPEEFARNVFYFEATYEQQYIAAPFAREHHIELRPVDWLPSRDDERLAFGRLEVVDVPPIRPAKGFQSFLTLDSASFHRTLFFADSEPWRREMRGFFDTLRPGQADFPRRLDLYRTFMQAMRIRSAAEAHAGDTLLVVIGAMHKVDLERILAGDPAIDIVQPSSVIPMPDSASAARALTLQDRFAIAAVNVLGVQNVNGPVDWPWVSAVVGELVRERGTSAEVRLLQTRLAWLRHTLSPEAAAQAFEVIGRDSAAAVPFTFTGVQDPRRIDSYFDPFGNMTVQQRALIEAARARASRGNVARVNELRSALLATARWTPLQEAQLDVYWTRYVLGPGSSHQ